MYGYFRPNKCGLTNKERRLFSCYYCRLCYCLRIKAGQLARYLTTFDAAIYSLAIHVMTGGEAPPLLRCQRFLKGNLKHFRNDEIGLKIADLSLIAFGEKIRDDIIDGDRARANVMNLFFARKVKRAQLAEPEMHRIFFEGTNNINALQEKNADLDTLIDTYGEISADVINECTPLTPEFREFFVALARWMYYIDILCDYNEDYKKNAPNPLRVDGLPTLQDYFTHHYAFVMSKTKEIEQRLVDALATIHNNSREWTVLNKLVSHAVNTVIPSIIMGEDVKYHLVRELTQNYVDNVKRERYRRRSK